MIHMVVMKKKTGTTEKKTLEGTTRERESAPKKSQDETTVVNCAYGVMRKTNPTAALSTASAHSSETPSHAALTTSSSTQRRTPAVSSAFNSPPQQRSGSLFSVFKDRPEMLVNILKSDPGFRNVLEKNPQMETLLNDPSTLEMLSDMMSDPNSMQNMMRQNDAVMNQISEIPGGEQMLERVMNVTAASSRDP